MRDKLKLRQKVTDEAAIWRDQSKPKNERRKARTRFDRALKQLANDPLDRLHIHLAAIQVADYAISGKVTPLPWDQIEYGKEAETR